MAEVDSLTIRINAETGSAVSQLKQITKLVERLNAVANDKGWKSFTTGFSKLGKAGENVEKLASSLKQLQDMQVSPRLKENFDKITNASEGLTGASKNISRFNSSLKRLSKTGAESDQMSQAYGRITGLLSKMSHSLSHTNFQALADGVNNFATAMRKIKNLGKDENLQETFTRVAHSIGLFANYLSNSVSDEILDRLERLGNALKNISSAASSATRTMKSLQKANQLAAGSTPAAKFAKGMQTAFKAVESVNKALSQMGSELYASFEATGIIADLNGMTSAIARSVPFLGELTEAWKSAASQIKSIVLSNASIVDKAAQIVLVRVSTIIRMLYSLVKLPFGSASMGITKGIMGLVVFPLKEVGRTLTEVKKKWDKFVSSLARIAIYRLIRTALKEIAKGLKEGVQNLYLWGQAWQNTYSSAAKFVATMDKLATAFLYLKNSIGAAISPLLDVVAPVIDALVDKFVALTNAINQALAALSGAGVWRRALKYQYTYAEAAGLTTKALKRTVLAFDELNKLDDKNKGGKNDNLDYSKMFEEVPVDDWLKRILESSDWRILGTGIASKINEMLANLNWDSIKSSARIWAERLGSLLDGALMGISMPLLGKSFAEGLNTIALFINEFFEQFHFRELGKHLSEGFESFINNLEWEEIGKALTQKWKALFELVIGFKDVDLSGLGSGIVELFKGAIENLPISEFMSAISELAPKIATQLGIAINGIFKETNQLLNGRGKGSGLNFKGLGESFGNAINNFFKEIDPKEAGIFLSNGIEKIIEFATGALKTTKWGDLNTWVSETITSLFDNIDLKQGVQNAIDLASRIVELLTTAINSVPWEDVGDAIAEADTTELKSGIKRLFDSITDGLERAGFMDEVATGIATYFGLKLVGAIAKVLPTILTAKAFSGAGAAGAGGAAAAGGGILGTVLGLGAAGTIGSFLGQQLSHHIIGPLLEGMGSADAELYKTWTFFGENGLFRASIDFAKFKVEDFETTIKNFGTGISNEFDLFATSISNGFNLFTDTLSGDKDAIILDLSAIGENFSAIADNWALEHPLITAGFDSIKKKIESFGTSWTSTFNMIKKTSTNALDVIQEKFSGVLGFLTGGINQLTNSINTLANTDLGKGVRTQSINTSRLNISRRASGGTVDKGDLFLAGEAGPEIVTSFGGDSAVMNMDQIISTISQSVALANGGDITIPISLDGNMLDKVIVTAQQRQNLRSGR